MKVFISWSGDTSKAIAETLRGWLPSVIQAVKPYYTPDDITKGARWNTEIAKELEECKVGLLCLTADNIEAPWIMFEAGALSKSLSAARVCPLLFGIEPSDIKGPLVQFQAASFAKDEMKKAIRMMNGELGAAALTSEVLDSVFEMWWPKLEEKVKKVLSSVQTPTEQTVRSERDILEEILARVRMAPPAPGIQAINQTSAISIEALLDLENYYALLVSETRHLPPDVRGTLEGIIDSLHRPIDHILRTSGYHERREAAMRADLQMGRISPLQAKEASLLPVPEGSPPRKLGRRLRHTP